jgi:hypothetical protein
VRPWGRDTDLVVVSGAPARPAGDVGVDGVGDYGMLLVPGFELTYNDPNSDRAAHAVAVGLHSLVGMDDGPVAAMEQARAEGAAILVAHPHDSGPTPAVPFPTCYFTRRWRQLRGLFDRVELFSGRQLFGWVAETGLPAVACSDLHRPNSFPAGRLSFPASTMSRRSSTICVRPSRCS